MGLSLLLFRQFAVLLPDVRSSLMVTLVLLSKMFGDNGIVKAAMELSVPSMDPSLMLLKRFVYRVKG